LIGIRKSPFLVIYYNKTSFNGKPIRTQRVYYSGGFKAKALKTYSNAEECKKQILCENKGKTGIYRWVNTISNKSYIGSSISLTERFTNYYNINHLKAHYNMLICRALLKEGYSKFNLEILEFCNPDTRFERENYYILNCAPEYNLNLTLQKMPSRLGHRHSESTKLKLSLNQQTRVGLSVTNIESKEKLFFSSFNLAAKHLGVHGGQISLYFSRRQVKPFLNRYILTVEEKVLSTDEIKPLESWRAGVNIKVKNIITNEIKIYDSLRSAARDLSIAHSTIRKYM